MKRTKLSDRQLPDYSRGEELMNMITHIVGGALGVIVLLTCVVRAALNQNYYGIVSCTIYGTTFITMFTISSVFSSGSAEPRPRYRRVSRLITSVLIFVRLPQLLFSYNI